MQTEHNDEESQGKEDKKDSEEKRQIETNESENTQNTINKSTNNDGDTVITNDGLSDKGESADPNISSQPGDISSQNRYNLSHHTFPTVSNTSPPTNRNHQDQHNIFPHDSELKTENETYRKRLFHKNGPKSPGTKKPVHSSTPIYDHGNIVDETFSLSSSRIDNTLLRIFSRSRDGNKRNDVSAPGEDKLLPFLNYNESELISMDAVYWRVHPMDAIHKGVLQQEMDFLEENLRPRDLLQRLYMDEVITHMDYNAIVRTEGQGERAVTRLLIRTLMRRGDKAYGKLIDTLKLLDYTFVYETLLKAETELRDTIDQERFSSQRRQSSLFNGLTPTYKHDVFNRHVTPSIDYSPVSKPNNATPVGDTEAPSHRTAIDAQRLDEHLCGLNAELKALHDDVSALQTARSLSQASGTANTRKNSIIAPENQTAPKSSSCSIL